MSDSPQPEKKIIIDEDWKAKVQAEKEAEKAAEPTAEPSAAAAPKAEPAEQARAASPLPAASLTFLAGTLYYQALVSLGLVPDPLSGKQTLKLTNARHTIDLLEVLWKKTEGNRTAEESQALDHMLHELRMAFVAVTEEVPPADPGRA